jgi:very-short-patch-repair endonuclease
MPVERGDRAVLAVAGRQHAVVTSAQLRDAGLGRNAVAHRIRTGWLRRRHRGVYLVGPLAGEHSCAMAAVLAVGPGALLSHDAAAALWGLRSPQKGPIDVTVAGRETRDRPGIRSHTARLHPRDATRKHGIPVTSPARTLLDLAATLPQRELDRAVEQAQVQRQASLHSLNEQFARYPGHRGAAALTRAIRTDPKLTRSRLERRMLALIRAARLPTPATNTKVCDWEVDLVWHPRRLVVELDSYGFHSTRAAFERDRRKDQELQATGWRVIRFTWRQITDEPEAVIAALATALAS